MVDEAPVQPDSPRKPRKSLVFGSVNTEEKDLIERARQKAGKPNMSVFVRETMLQRAEEILTPRKGERRQAA